MTDRDPTRPQFMMLNLDVSGVGTQDSAESQWKALAYLVGSQAFCEAANSPCVCSRQKHALAEAAELYAELALEQVDLIRRARESGKPPR